MDDDLNKKSVVELLSLRGRENQEYIEVIYKKIKEEIEEENNCLLYLLESEVYYSFATAQDKAIELRFNVEFCPFERYAKLVNCFPFDHPARIIWDAIKYKIKDEYRFNEYTAQIIKQLEAYGFDKYSSEIEKIHSEKSLDEFCRNIIYYTIERKNNDDDKIRNNQKLSNEY